ncbi:MAG: helix-turn-helix domain-containing protein [Flavobacteriaceae bacterium]
MRFNLKKHYFLLFILFTCSFFAQKKDLSVSITDSIIKYSNNDFKKLIFFSKELQKTNNFCDIISGLSTESKGYYLNKDYATSEKLVNKILSTDKKNLNQEQIICLKRKKINALNRLFWIRINQENYNNAYEQIIKSEKINESFIDKGDFYYRYKLNLETSKALIKAKLNLFDEAKDILIKAYADIEKIPFKDSLGYNSILIQKSSITNSIGDNYLNLSKEKSKKAYIDSADVYYKKAFDISKNFTPKHSDSEIVYYLKKTEIYIAKKQYKKAIELINNYPNINKDYNYHHYQSFQKTICFYNLKNIDSTFFFSKLFLKEKNKKCKRSNLITIYDIISNQYHDLNKLDSAYKYSKLTLKEFNTAKSKKEKTYQLLYDNDFNKIKKLNSSLKESTKDNSFLYILLISSVLIIIFFYAVFKKKNKGNKYQNTREPITTKKNYNIDISLEKKIIKKLDSIEDNLEFLHSDFSINKLADSLKTNTSYLSYFFNKRKQTSFKLYYGSLKMDYLIKKLKEDKLYRKYTIETLGKEIGYTNPSAFTRAFKKHTGLTPSSFIKSLKD